MDRVTRRHAGLCVLAWTLTAATAFAQAPADTPAPVTTLTQDEIDEIIVTGSRIARPELTAMSPFAVLNEEQIRLSNQTNIENFLRNSPQFAQAVGSSTNNGNDGSATIDLRNLGEERTLVLVNGKRFVPYDYQGYVDASMIPVSLIERVEVITGGASAVYGADAVAGVVNFIMKDEFEGLEFNSSYSQTDESDGDTYDFNVTAGGDFAGGRGNLVFNVGYTKQDPISQGDRSYSFEALGSADMSPSGSANNTGSTVLYSSFFGDAQEGCVQFEDSGDPRLTCDSDFNYNPYNLFQVPQKKWTATALGKYEINENVEFFTRGSFANNRVDTIIAPTATFFYPFQLNVADVASGGNPFLTPATRAYLQSIDANECDQPQVDPDTGEFTGPCLAPSAGAGDGMIDVSLGRRLVELGTRDSLYENTAYQFVGGFRGSIWDDQDWELFGQYGRTSRNQNFLNDNSYSRVQQSLLAVDDGSGNIVCSDPSGGCIPGNYFGAGNLAEDVSNFIRLNLAETNKTDQMVFGGSLSGDLPAQLPIADRALSYAVGVEYRRDQGENRPDDNYATGNSPGFGASSPVDAEIEVEEIFGELLIPVLSDARFARSINIETGVRYAEYNNDVNTAAGSYDNTFYNTSWKLGGDWSPVDDLRFNLMYQRAVRAPTLREIGLPKTPSAGDLSDDPCDNEGTLPGAAGLTALCEATGVPVGLAGTFTSIIAGQINNFLGGNPNLEPEEADTITAGFDWTPAFLEGLSVSVDYYDIDIDDAIVELAEQDIVNACYFVEQDANGPFCQLIARNPITGGLVGGTDTGIFRELANVASESAQGIDFLVRYAFDAGGGTVDVGINANYVIERKTQTADFIAEYDCAGLVGNTCLRPNPEWTFVQTTRWTMGPATVQLQWHYIDGVTQDEVAFGNMPASDFAVPSIASQSYFDVTGAYDLNDVWSIRGGISNLFDRDPPIVGNDYGGTAENSGNTFPATYPSIGRGYFLGASARF